jgi:hypothetical protein
VVPSGDGERTLYSEATRNEKNMKRFKLTVKSKEIQSPETIKGLLKSKMNPN